MPKKIYVVELTGEEREELTRLVRTGKAAAQKRRHGQILLKADAGPAGPAWTDERIAEALEVGRATVERVRKRLVTEGLEAALVRRKPRRVYPRKLDGDAEAHLIALACSEAPPGRAHWTLRLLADQMVELGYVESVSYQTVRRTLKKTRSSRG